MKNYALGFGFLVLFVPLTSEALSPGEGIVLDRNTGDYIITYANAVGRLKQSRFVPSTKIDPNLRTKFENQQGLIHYRYTIKNGSRSKQPLAFLILDPVSGIHSKVALPRTVEEFNQTTQQLVNDPVRLEQYVNQTSGNGAGGAIEVPNGWSCDISPNGISERSDFRIACSFDGTDEQKHNGLQASNSLAGFGFHSMDLPGIGVARLSGFGDIGPSFEDEGPDGEISDQLEALQKNDYVPRNAAVPTITVPASFDAAMLLDRIRSHIATWPSKQLLDSTYAAQLDRHLAAAANAYRLNNTKAGRENIESARKLLEREHKFLDYDNEDNDDTPEHKHATRLTIDRLAARVLDFDLRYVLKRMERGHEHEHGDGDRRKEQERK